MVAPNDIQRTVLKGMRGYRVIMQDTHGALVVAPAQQYQRTKVIDVDGCIYSLNCYMSMRHPSRNQRPRSPPSH